MWIRICFRFLYSDAAYFVSKIAKFAVVFAAAAFSRPLFSCLSLLDARIYEKVDADGWGNGVLTLPDETSGPQAKPLVPPGRSSSLPGRTKRFFYFLNVFRNMPGATLPKDAI